MSAPRPRRDIDDLLAFHLASGLTIARAAERVGVNERTVRRRLTDANFRKRLFDLRSEALGRAVAMLADGMTKAAERLVGLVGASDEKMALAACKAVLELGMRLRQAEETERKVEDLTRRVNALLTAEKSCDENRQPVIFR